MNEEQRLPAGGRREGFEKKKNYCSGELKKKPK